MPPAKRKPSRAKKTNLDAEAGATANGDAFEKPLAKRIASRAKETSLDAEAKATAAGNACEKPPTKSRARRTRFPETNASQPSRPFKRLRRCTTETYLKEMEEAPSTSPVSSMDNGSAPVEPTPDDGADVADATPPAPPAPARPAARRPVDSDVKAMRSRKSAAYHRVRKQLISEGKDEETAKAEAKRVT
jgi:hypothetical protein